MYIEYAVPWLSKFEWTKHSVSQIWHTHEYFLRGIFSYGKFSIYFLSLLTAPPNQNLVSKNRLFWFFLLFYWVHILGSENYFFEIFHRWNSEKNVFFYFRPNIPNNVNKMVGWSGFWVFWVMPFSTLANKSNPMLRNFFWLHPSSLVPGM